MTDSNAKGSLVLFTYLVRTTASHMDGCYTAYCDKCLLSTNYSRTHISNTHHTNAKQHLDFPLKRILFKTIWYATMHPNSRIMYPILNQSCNPIYLVSLKLFAQHCFLPPEVAQQPGQLYPRPLDSAVHQPHLIIVKIMNDIGPPNSPWYIGYDGICKS